jgi:RHS repeat-associated protein
VGDLGVGIQPWSYVDFDGDGRAEVVKSILGTGDGFAHLLVWKLPRGGWSTTPSNLFLDVMTDVPHGTTVAGPFSTDYADFDGDGRTDVLVQGPDAACGSDSAGTKVRLRVYLNRINGRLIDGASAHFVAATENGPLCLARTVYQPSGVIESEVFSRSNDFNGDGTADLFLTYSHGQTTEQRLVFLYPGSSANSVAFDSTPMSSIGLSQDEIDTSAVNRSAMVRWIDINGDGLEDFVFAQTGGSIVPSGQWLVRFNIGGALSDFIATGATFGLGTYGGNVNPVSGNRYRYDNRIKPIDVDSDGRTELLFPVRVGAMICSYYRVPPPPPMGCDEPPAGGGPPEVTGTYPGACEEIQECPVDPLTGVEIEPSGTHHGRFTIWNLYLPEGHGPARDQSTYVMHPMRFVIGDVNAATGLPSVKVQEVQQDLYGDVGEDVYGDGLGDVVVPIGCGSSPCLIFADGNSTSNRPSQLPDGTLVDSLTEGRKLYINHNYGVSGSATDTYPLPPLAPDFMHAAVNGVNDWTAWVYVALGGELPAGFMPLYTLPSENPYVDERHYYFTSSMPVVQTMAKSTGNFDGDDPTVKAGARSWTYAYQEAMYNHRGRGFQGFRKIIQRQEPAATEADRAIRIETTYHQKFPLTGKVEEVEISDPDHPATPIRRETTEWRCNLANRNVLCPGDGTNPSAPQPNTVYFPYLDNQIVQNYNLASAEAGGSSLVSTVETINADTSGATASGWDASGNLVHQHISGQDEGSGGTFVSLYTIDTDRSFVTNTNNWWLDKLTQQVVKSDISYSGTHALPAGASAPSRTVTTAYTWNPDRTPDVQTVQPGIPNQQLSTQYGYPTPSYGLPTSISITGLGVSPQPRVTEMNYTKNGTSVAADGYFVLDTTNAMNQTTTTERRARDGQVSRQIEPSDLSTVFSYDAFGKLIRADYKDANDATLEPPLYTSWNRCVNGGCPGNYYGEGTGEDFAAWRVTKVKNGTPTEVHWYDLLGREVKQAHRGFDGTFIQTLTEYDSLGLPKRTSVPHFAGSTPYWTTFNSYDRLGRVTQKTAPGADIINVITNYTYTGTETKIKVRAANLSGTGNCPTTTNLCMDMRRYTDVLGRLVKTVQALDGNSNYATTRYWYDGPGNPVAAEDAEGNVTRATYDARGRRTQMDDPDAGTWNFTYDGLGELLTQTDARGVVTEHVYDALGRLTQRTATAPGTLPDPNLHVLRDSWDWDPLDAPGQLGSLTREWGVSTGSLSDIWSETYDYSPATQRLDNQQTTIGGSPETTSYTYDTYGREQSRTYPSSVAVKSSYAANGELSALGPWPSGASWWTATDKDAWGNVTGETYFGVTMGSHTTWPRTGQYEQKKWTRAGQTIDQWDYEYDTFGNLEKQERSVLPGAGVPLSGTFSENYEYDGMQRITGSHLQGVCSGSICTAAQSTYYRYKASGNFSSKSDYSDVLPNSYRYGGFGCGPHGVSYVEGTYYNPDGFHYRTYYCDANGNIVGGNTISGWYDFNNQPWYLSRVGAGTADFRYTPDGKVFQQDATTHTTSSGPRGYEVTNYAGSTIERHELGPIIVVRENGVNTVRGILRDRLGSLVTMLNSGGNFITYRSFDPFGKTRGGNFAYVPNGTFNFLPHSLHGFTDHNHIDDVWLLHMNGRVYDYQLGRFLSPDPLIQFPANSQSLNPYSYILNNPLAGRDPSGYAACMGAPKDGETCTATETPTGSHIAKNYTIGASGGKFYVAAGGGAAATTRVQGAMKANGAIGQGVTGAGGIRDQAAPGADKGAGRNEQTVPAVNDRPMRHEAGELHRSADNDGFAPRIVESVRMLFNLKSGDIGEDLHRKEGKLNVTPVYGPLDKPDRSAEAIPLNRIFLYSAAAKFYSGPELVGLIAHEREHLRQYSIFSYVGRNNIFDTLNESRATQVQRYFQTLCRSMCSNFNPSDNFYEKGY